jgi:hypothetical protein
MESGLITPSALIRTGVAKGVTSALHNQNNGKAERFIKPCWASWQMQCSYKPSQASTAGCHTILRKGRVYMAFFGSIPHHFPQRLDIDE